MSASRLTTLDQADELGAVARDPRPVVPGARRQTRRRPRLLPWLLGASCLTGFSLSAQDAKTVRLLTLNPLDTLYVLLGGGGNALALLRDDDVVLVDTKAAGWGTAIKEAIEAATDKPVTMVINTHGHSDHAAATPELASVTRVVAHENARRSMERMDAFRGPGAKFLPTTLVRDRQTLLDGRDRIELYHFGPAHTDGDLVVVLPERRVAYFGDLFPSKSVPVVDEGNGGSAVAFPETLARAVAAITGVFRVITGHEEGLRAVRDPRSTSVDISTPTTMQWADVQEYAEFTRDLLASARAAQAAGRAPADAAANLALPDRYKSYDMRGAAAYVEAVYRELDRR